MYNSYYLLRAKGTYYSLILKLSFKEQDSRGRVQGAKGGYQILLHEEAGTLENIFERSKGVSGGGYRVMMEEEEEDEGCP